MIVSANRLCLAAVVAAVMLIGTAVGAQQRAPTAGRSIAMIAKVPLTSRDGASIQLDSRVAAGKPTLIAFWASWCMPCLIEAPYLRKIRAELGDRYNFIYINRREGNPDPDQPPAAMTQFLSRSGLGDTDYVIADVPAYRTLIGKDLRDIPEGKVGLPRIYLFDREGRQIYTSYGFSQAEGPALERMVRQAVAK